MNLQMPTRLNALVDSSKRASAALLDVADYLINDGERAIELGRRRLEVVEAELAKLTFAHQLLKTLQFAREAKWKEAYAEIEAAGLFARTSAEYGESWSLVRYQLDYMRVEADGGPVA